MERFWLQHRYLHAFKGTQKWTKLQEGDMGFKFGTKWADEENLIFSYP